MLFVRTAWRMIPVGNWSGFPKSYLLSVSLNFLLKIDCPNPSDCSNKFRLSVAMFSPHTFTAFRSSFIGYQDTEKDRKASDLNQIFQLAASFVNRHNGGYVFDRYLKALFFPSCWQQPGARLLRGPDRLMSCWLTRVRLITSSRPPFLCFLDMFIL